MPISSETLFHFTNTLENLLNILRRTFLPHWSLENLNVILPKGESHDNLVFGIPMVSFCDIPLSQTINHMQIYGSYGIGMTKDWGKKNGICPVLYTYSGSNYTENINNLAKLIVRDTDNVQLSDQLMKEFYDIVCNIKPYDGPLKRKGRKNKKVRFYNEREWRYVSKSQNETFPFGLDKHIFEDNNVLREANDRLHEEDQIMFTPNDIKYLIVAKENEILPLIASVESIKNKFSQDEIKLLSTRIISAQQIEDDF